MTKPTGREGLLDLGRYAPMKDAVKLLDQERKTDDALSKVATTAMNAEAESA